MPDLTLSVIIFINILFRNTDCQSFLSEKTDTNAINKQTTDALAGARIKPDLSISLALQAMQDSRMIKYRKGIADASLALGTAWLAKYNRGDSAMYYNMQAYELYNEMNDIRGKARACYGLSYVFSFKGDLPESERYGALSLSYFDQAGDKRGMINSYSVLSYLAKQQKEFRKATGLIQQAIDIARTENDTMPLADATNSLGNIFKDMALFSQAIDSYFEALKLWEGKGDSTGISIAYGSIGLMYYYQKEWKKALEFCFKKLPLVKAKGDLWEVSKTCNTIAQIYNSKTCYDSALIFLKQSLALNKEMNYPTGIASSYHNLANTFLLLPEHDSAYYYITAAVSLADKIKDPAIVNYYITFGKIQKATGNFQLALKYTLIAYKTGKKQHQPLIVYESSALLSEIYSLMNRNDLAYSFLKEYQLMNDSISNDDFLKRVTRLEIQYEYDKKQKAAEFAQMEERIIRDNKIRRQNLYVKGLIILASLIVLTSLLYIRHNRLRSKYARIDLEQRLLRAQMNPHFISNSLCAVQDFILADKPQKANTFLTKIARLMRNILENSREEFIPLEMEIETLKLYLDVQQLRFETEFEYTITLDESIDPENLSVPPMLAQPCVENSIEHGLLHTKRKGELNIRYALYDGLIRLEIADNGIGREQSSFNAAANNKKHSISTMVNSKRLEHFRKTLRKKDIKYEITDLYDNGEAAGTKVIMLIPYRKIYS